MQSTWQEMDMAGLDASDVAKTMAKSIDDQLYLHDEWLDEH